MLSKEKFRDGIEKLLMFYPNWTIKADDPKVMKEWYEIFKNMKEENFVTMINKHINTVLFNPTIASLNECNRNAKGEKLNEPIYR